MYSQIESPHPETLRVMHWNVNHGSKPEDIVGEVERVQPDIFVGIECAMRSPRYHDQSIHSALLDVFDHVEFTPTHTLVPKSGEKSGEITVLDAAVIATIRHPIIAASETILSEDEAYDPDHAGVRKVSAFAVRLATQSPRGLTVMASHRSIPFPQNLLPRLDRSRSLPRLKRSVIGQETSRMHQAVTSAIDSGDDILVAGDFNVPPYLAPVRTLSRQLRRIDGEHDTSTVVPPHTFHGRTIPPQRVDFMFHSQGIQVVETYVGEFGISDHKWLAADIRQVR